VLESPAELRTEVHRLRAQPGETALFAAALFDLERARRGDTEARTQLLEVADSLLVFWRDRSGDGLADSHPALGPLWATASALLISFEVKRFTRALDACWEARGDAATLQVAIQGLQPPGNRRVEFAACLYHLELARLFVDSSRGEFARRAGLIHEAYHSKEVADELVGEDPGLQHLWKELIPYLDEFFEALEDEAERKSRSEVVTSPGGSAAAAPPVPPPPDITPVHGLAKVPAKVDDSTVMETPATPPAAEKREPVTAPNPSITAPVPPPRPSDASGVFELWLAEPERAGRKPKPTAPPPSAPSPVPSAPSAPLPMEAVDVDMSTAPRPAHKPANLTPAPAPAEILELAEVESDGFVPADQTMIGRPPPPPPGNFTPAPNSLQAMTDITEPKVRVVAPPPPPDFTPPPARPNNQSGILDLADIVEEVPASSRGKVESGVLELAEVVEDSPTRRPLRPSLDIETDYEPDAAAQAFWRHTEAGLGLLPPADAPRMDRRALSAEGRAERKKLNSWLDGVTKRFDTVPESRAFACLIRLYMAAQLKEKGLFGGVNAKRREAFVSALELLSPEPGAAGRCAVWFELDGKESVEHLNNGLEVLTDYLQFCARQNLDPLDPAVPGQFLP
jgi:hypothetical protein